MATYSSILAWRIPWTEERSLSGYSPWGCKESDVTEACTHRIPREQKSLKKKTALKNPD